MFQVPSSKFHVSMIVVVLALVVAGCCPTPVPPRSAPMPTVINGAAIFVCPTPGQPPAVAPELVGIPCPTSMPEVPAASVIDRNLIGVVTNKAGVDVYAQIDLYWDPDHVGGVALVAGRPRVHLAAGEYVLVQNIWGLLAEIRYGEGWQQTGWVSVRELCTHPWCQPVR